MRYALLINKTLCIPCLLAGLFLISARPAIAQGSATQRRLPQGLAQIAAAVDTFNNRLPEEKLFLHFDKPYYAIGDTIWFKAYLFQGATHAYSPRSGLLYVELINDSSKQVKRISIPVTFGLSWGQFALEDNSFAAGNYTIRAYTRWMENFGEAVFFHRRLFIAPATLPELQARTSAASAELKRSPSAGAGAASSRDRSARQTHAAEIDLQFMPEGGWLVAGLPARIGFKAIGEDGLGQDLSGTIIDSKGNTVTTFQSLYKGMGKFDLPGASGETYTALVTLPDGRTKRFPLPAAKRSGYILRVDNRLGSDSIKVAVLASPDLVDGRTLHLVGLGRGIICFGASMRLNKAEQYGIVPKSAFPSGIAHFTLFDDAAAPLCERITYIDHDDDLKIRLVTDKDAYTPRDSISLHILVTNAQGQPLTGSFSLAVTDNSQVRTDYHRAENIVSRLLLTSGLNGTVETPSWYLSSHTEETWQALDALLLTQGWTGYQWKDIFHEHRDPPYAAEPGFRVTGTVTNLLNRPVHNAKVSLIGMGRMELAMDTVTGDDGRFLFYKFPPLDSAGFVLQARNAKGNSMGLGLTVDEFKPPVLPASPARPAEEGFEGGTDSTLFRYVQNNEAIQNAKDPYGGRYKTLQKVVVRATPIIRGSHNLNGAGQADQVIDEQTILKAGKVTLKDLLLQNVKGFRITYSKTGIEEYMFFQDHLRFVIDGLNLSRFGAGQERETLEFLTAEDIVGIEVMHTPKNTAGYNSTFLSSRQLMTAGREIAFIEITTRSGNGIFMKKTPGVVTYRPMPVSWPQAFYSPRYPVKQETSGSKPADLRATIHWQPSVITNKEGQAFASFYSADTPSTYTIIVQGSDMDGNVGIGTKQITISR